LFNFHLQICHVIFLPPDFLTISSPESFPSLRCFFQSTAIFCKRFFTFGPLFPPDTEGSFFLCHSPGLFPFLFSDTSFARTTTLYFCSGNVGAGFVCGFAFPSPLAFPRFFPFLFISTIVNRLSPYPQFMSIRLAGWPLLNSAFPLPPQSVPSFYPPELFFFLDQTYHFSKAFRKYWFLQPFPGSLPSFPLYFFLFFPSPLPSFCLMVLFP